MKKKKLTALFMAVVMSTGLLSGCGSASDTSDQGVDNPASASTVTEDISLYSEPGELPIVNEPITLTVFAPANDDGTAWEDNTQVKELEEETGIHIEWQTCAASDNIQEKLSTIFASGDMPDIILTGCGTKNRYDKATEQALGEQGLVIPLNEYIDTVSVGYKAAFENIEGLKDYITTPSGNIYSLPNVDGALHVQYGMKLWINTEWLDNLNLEMPTTTEEFYQVMKAFKEYDANGNGDPNDEIPLSTVASGSGTQIDGFLMDPFQLISEGSKLYVDDGKVTFAPMQEGYRDGLKYLNKMYSEGLINPESFTQDLKNQVNVNESGDECVIGAFLAQRPGYACDLTTEPYSTKWQQYQCVPPLTGPTGQCIASWNPYTMFATGMTFITSSCKYPEAAFRLLDYLATEKETYRSALGVEGVHYVMLDEDTTELGIDGVTKAQYKRTEVSNSGQALLQLACLIRTPEFRNLEATNPDPYAEDVKPLYGRLVIMYKDSKEQEKVRQPLESVMPDLYMNQEDASELALLKTNVMDTQKEYMVQFITGEKDIDSNWDNYIAALNNVGAQRYLELLQNAYDVSAFAK